MTNTSEIIRIGQIEIRFLLDGNDTNGLMAMFECVVPVGARVPLPHSHTHYDETVYGIEGVVDFTIDGKLTSVSPGETEFIPRGVVHGFTNSKQTDVKILCVITPAAIGPDFFKDQAVIVNAGGPPDMEKMKEIFKKYGIVPAMPKA